MKFDLTKPCADCPFRTDKPFHLRPERAREICDSLLSGATFSCHKTVDYGSEDYDDDGSPLPRIASRNEQHCAGALIMLDHMGNLFESQLVRIAARLGRFDPDALDMTAPVYESDLEFVQAMRELERCPR